MIKNFYYITIAAFMLLFIACSDSSSTIVSVEDELLSNNILSSQDSIKTHVDSEIDSTIENVYKIYIIRVDTIYIGDSVIVKNDTVFSANSDELFELPRDTSIIDTITVNDTLYSKTFDGIVYDRTFYSYNRYQFSRYEDGKYLITDDEKDSYKTNACGEYFEPDSANGYWTEWRRHHNIVFNDWHIFNQQDGYKMNRFLRLLVDKDTKVFVKYITTGYKLDGYSSGYVGITMYGYPYDIIMIDEDIEYLCAKELK